MSVMEFVLFSVMLRTSSASSVALLGCFCCENEATYPEADEKKR